MANNKQITQKTLQKCEKAIAYNFHDISLLENALTHASLREHNGECNERMEFLGDAILGMVISEYLYRTFYDFDEGDLSLIKSEVVSRVTLARIAKNLKLDDCFLCSKGVQKHKKEIPVSMLANVMEAVIGAIYLDSGLKEITTFIENNFRLEVEKVVRNPYQKNYKSLLQFLTQKYFGETPSYKILRADGPNHTKVFTSCAVIGSRKFIAGKGKNKKEAEQGAAYAAIQILVLEKPEIGEYVQNMLGEKKKKSDPLSDPTMFHNSKLLLDYVVNKFSLPAPIYHKTHTLQAKKKFWFVSVSLGGRNFPSFTSDTRKEAERLAACEALHILAEEHSSKSPLWLPTGQQPQRPPLWQRLQWLA